MKLTIGLVGNPNCGKTTLFNQLTGLRQKVGNWPGVTVERKSGFFRFDNIDIEVIDLPGVYSLTVPAETSIDERIACEYILSKQADVIINILDASNLERHLYLTLQLLEMKVPVILAVNMMDVADRRGIQLKLDVLEKALGCPVVQLTARRGKGIPELKKTITTANKKEVTHASWQTLHVDWLMLRLLEDDVYVRQLASPDMINKATEIQQQIRHDFNEDADILIADSRYRFIQQLVQEAVQKTTPKSTWTDRFDQIVLNRLLGIPIFLCVMYCMFLFAINIGGAFQDFFDISSNALFVQGTSQWLISVGAPTWLIALVANGIGKGINTTVTFIPVIGAMFLCLAMLEDSGYMARAAFVIDRAMRALGLPGKSFVPLIIGFGCNVPAVMAARTLENKRDRILTIMMSPFMSCGARLAIYAVFVAAFFPRGGHNVVFCLYMIGILMAVATGFLLRKTVLKGEPAPLMMELPNYHVPRLPTLMMHAWQRLKSFIFRAGKLIIPICVLIGILNSLNLDGTLNSGEGDSHSILSIIGMKLTPLFAPLGLETDNWPATVGLLTGVLAKEVVVGTLNTLYSQLGQVVSSSHEVFNFWDSLQAAFTSIGHNFAELAGAISNPILAKAPVHTLNQGVYGVMADHFNGSIGAMAYLLFVLLYFPCVSTTAAMVRELNWQWTLFSVLWSTGVAYAVAVIFYQLATFMQHPSSSTLWLLGTVSIFIFVTLWLQRRRYEFA